MKGNFYMKKILSLVAGSVAIACGVTHAATCIIDGSTVRACASSGHAVVADFETRSSARGWMSMTDFESRIRWSAFAVIPKFRSDKPFHFVITIR